MGDERVDQPEDQHQRELARVMLVVKALHYAKTGRHLAEGDELQGVSDAAQTALYEGWYAMAPQEGEEDLDDESIIQLATDLAHYLAG